MNTNPKNKTMDLARIVYQILRIVSMLIFLDMSEKGSEKDDMQDMLHASFYF